MPDVKTVESSISAEQLQLIRDYSTLQFQMAKQRVILMQENTKKMLDALMADLTKQEQDLNAFFEAMSL